MNTSSLISNMIGLPIMLYPMIKAKEEKAKLSKELSIAKPVEFTPEIKELIRTGKVVILTDYNSLQRWTAKNIPSFYKQEAINKLGITSFVDSTSPMLVKSETVPDHAAILASPAVVNSQLVAKQFGHYLANTDRKELKSIFRASFLGGKNTPYYRAEQQAWDRSGIKNSDPIKQLDLNKERSNISSAMGLPYGAAAMLITKILLNGASK